MKAPMRPPAAFDYDAPAEAPAPERGLTWLARIWKATSFYVITALVFLLLNLFVVRLGLVNGQSMEPTLYNRDIVVIWQLAYRPRPGDIIVTNDDNALDLSLTKRVIATGGQTLSVTGGAVYVDGMLRDEDYLKEADWGGGDIELTVPDGQVFLMGDNRNDSYDSRALGCFATKDLMGKVVARIFPFSAMRGFATEG